MKNETKTNATPARPFQEIESFGLPMYSGHITLDYTKGKHIMNLYVCNESCTRVFLFHMGIDDNGCVNYCDDVLPDDDFTIAYLDIRYWRKNENGIFTPTDDGIVMHADDCGTIYDAYRGLTFRSRLEAHWARLFDLLDLDFVYEPAGYSIDDECYLPDFLVLQWNTYIEIKPMNYDTHDERHRKLSTIGIDVCVFSGYPRAKLTTDGNDFRSFFKATIYRDGQTIVDFADATLAESETGISLLYKTPDGITRCYRFNGADILDNYTDTISDNILTAYQRESICQFLGGKEGKINDNS